MPRLARYESWRPASRRTRTDGIAAALVGLFVLVLIVKLTCFSVVAIGIGFQAANRLKRFLNRRRLRGLADLPAPDDQFPVEVTFHRQTDYGSDYGLLSFVDEWLVFEGERTRFSVSNGDVGLDEDTLSFSFDGPGGTHWTTFSPLDEKAFKASWERWQQKGQRTRSEAVLLPPVHPVPERNARRGWWGVGAVLIIGVLIVLDMVGQQPVYWASVAVIVTVFTPLTLGYAFHVLRNDAELRRLALDLPPTFAPWWNPVADRLPRRGHESIPRLREPSDKA